MFGYSFAVVPFSWIWLYVSVFAFSLLVPLSVRRMSCLLKNEIKGREIFGNHEKNRSRAVCSIIRDNDLQRINWKTVLETLLVL